MCSEKHELEFKPLNETPQQLEQRTKYTELERFPESFVNDWGTNWAKHGLHQQNTGGTFWTSFCFSNDGLFFFFFPRLCRSNSLHKPETWISRCRLTSQMDGSIKRSIEGRANGGDLSDWPDLSLKRLRWRELSLNRTCSARNDLYNGTEPGLQRRSRDGSGGCGQPSRQHFWRAALVVLHHRRILQVRLPARLLLTDLSLQPHAQLGGAAEILQLLRRQLRRRLRRSSLEHLPDLHGEPGHHRPDVRPVVALPGCQLRAEGSLGVRGLHVPTRPLPLLLQPLLLHLFPHLHLCAQVGRGTKPQKVTFKQLLSNAHLKWVEIKLADATNCFQFCDQHFSCQRLPILKLGLKTSDWVTCSYIFLALLIFDRSSSVLNELWLAYRKRSFLTQVQANVCWPADLTFKPTEGRGHV